MVNQYDEQTLIQYIYSAISQKNEHLLDKYWKQFKDRYPLIDDLLAAKWQFDFDKHNFDIILEEAEQLQDGFALIYPQAYIIYLESYLALNQPEVALQQYYGHQFIQHPQSQLLLAKIHRAIDAQQQIYSHQLAIFDSLNHDEQLLLLENLLQSQSRFYIDAVSQIVEQSNNQVIITWGLLYLKQANSQQEIVYHRSQLTYIIKPYTLPNIEESQVYQMNQQILNYIDKHHPHIKEVAKFITTLLFNHHYPNYHELYSIEEWVQGIEAYYNYVLFGREMDMTQDVNQMIVDMLYNEE